MRLHAWLFFLLCGLQPAFAADAPKPKLDPQAKELLQGMSDYLTGLQSFSVEAHALDEKVTTDGQKIQFPTSSQVQVRRPNALRVQRERGDRNVVFTYDGRTFSVVDSNTNYWAQVPAPADLDSAVDVAQQKYGIDAPGADLLVSHPAKELLKDVQSSAYLGTELIDGARCHHLAFRGKDVDWQIWIEDGERPLPHRYTITSKNVKMAPEFTVRLSKWTLDPNLPEDAFAFRPPPGGKQINLMGESRRQGRR